MADSAEPGASCAAKGGEQIVANATAAACPYRLHEPAATGLFEFYDHPMESNLLPPPQVPKEPPRDP